MIVYDLETTYGLDIQDNQIAGISRKPLFKYDDAFTPSSVERDNYGMIGTAFYAGNDSSPHLVRYKAKTGIVNLTGRRKVDILERFSVCDSVLDIEEFKRMMLKSFFTSEEDLMPLLGYSFYRHKLKVNPFRRYEQDNNLDGIAMIENADFLDGDCYGQMTQLLVKGHHVFNDICRCPVKSPFYGKTLSILPLKDGHDPVIVMRRDMFNELFHETVVLSDLSEVYPVPVCFNDDQHKVFGMGEAKVYCGTADKNLNEFWTFMDFFSKGAVKFIYAYDGCHSNLVCGKNKILKKA